MAPHGLRSYERIRRACDKLGWHIETGSLYESRRFHIETPLGSLTYYSDGDWFIYWFIYGNGAMLGFRDSNFNKKPDDAVLKRVERFIYVQRLP